MTKVFLRKYVCWGAVLSACWTGVSGAESPKSDISTSLAPLAMSNITSAKVPVITPVAIEDAQTMQVGALYQYKHKNGSVTLTNRPQKYEHRVEYTQVHIEYQRVAVPKKYIQYTDPSQYTSDEIFNLVQRYSAMYGLEPNLVLAVIKCESNGNPRAVSKVGAKGLMQLMPATAAEMGVTKIFDPAQNIAGGTQYLYKMLELFDGNVKYALAGYNAGPENVKKYKGIPPFAETQNYVRVVLQRYNEFSKGGQATIARNLTYDTSSAIVTAKLDDKQMVPVVKPTGKYMIHFHSGLSQPADLVEDKDPYYYIQVGRRTYPVRKQLVKMVEELS